MTSSVRTDSAAEVLELLDEIESVTEGSFWELSTSQVFAIVDATLEDYVKFLYDRKEGELPEETFHPENVHQLVDFLVARGYRHAASDFRRSGVHLPRADLLDWLEFFQSVTISRLISRDVDRELLETAVAGCRRFEDAAEFYCRAQFDPEELKLAALRAFLERSAIPDHDLSRGRLLSFLDTQFRLRVLRWEDLEQALIDALRSRAIAWGLAAEEPVNGALSAAIVEALSILELPGRALPERTSLRKRYRMLLRRYHPDLNPAGLEKTTQLIEAYGVVARALEGVESKS